MTVNLQDSRDASHRGWGPGWPHCQSAQMGKVTWSNGVSPVPSVRKEIIQLVTLLGNETIRRGYHLKTPGCWGYACRAIGGTSVPSNHSWGLAVDLNAPTNPQHDPLRTDMPSWMPDLWNTYGFRWGGDYQHATPDPMHYEFMGTPGDAVAMTTKAVQAFLHPTPVPDPKPVPTPSRGTSVFMYLKADKSHAVLVEGGKSYLLPNDGHLANQFANDGAVYITDVKAADEAWFVARFGTPVA